MKKKKEGRKMHIGRVIALAVVVLIAAFITYSGIHGGKLMNGTVNKGLEILSQTYPLTEDTENSYKTLTVKGMKFNVRHYTAEGLGNVCVMTMNMGLMQMLTFVVTPYEKQMPMFSVDCIYAMSNRKAIVEFYDLVPDTGSEEYRSIIAQLQAVLDEFSDLNDYETKDAWYDSLLTASVHKKGSASQDARFSALFEDAVSAYVEASAALQPLSEEAQAEKLGIIDSYVADSVEKGGLSTDMFKKALGEDTTRDFFFRVFYGPDGYRK